MTKRIAYFEAQYGRVYPPPEDGPPLVKGAPPIGPESEPEYAPPRPRLCAVLALLWYIAFASILGASYIYLLKYPLPADHITPWPSALLGVVVGLVLWGITLLLRRCARRKT